MTERLQRVGGQVVLEGVQRFQRDSAQVYDSLKQINKGTKSLETTTSVSWPTIGKAIAMGVGAAEIAMAALRKTIEVTANALVGIGNDMQVSMQSVAAAADVPLSSLGPLRQTVFDIAEESTLGIQRLTDVADQLVRGGISIEDVMSGALQAVNDFYIASGREVRLEQGVLTVAAALNAFKLPGTEAVRVVNALTAAAMRSAITFTDVDRSFRQSAAISAMLGFEVEDLATALGVLGGEALRSSDAGTSLRQMFVSLMGPTARATSLMQYYGISLYDSEQKALGLRDIIMQLESVFGEEARAISGMSDAQRDFALATIFGSDAVRASIALINAGVKGWDEMRASMEELTAQEVAQNMIQENVNAEAKIFLSNLQVLAATFSLEFLPALGKTMNKVNDFMRSLDTEKITMFGRAISVALSGQGETDLRIDIGQELSEKDAAGVRIWLDLLLDLRTAIVDYVIPAVYNMYKSLTSNSAVVAGMSSFVSILGQALLGAAQAFAVILNVVGRVTNAIVSNATAMRLLIASYLTFIAIKGYKTAAQGFMVVSQAAIHAKDAIFKIADSAKYSVAMLLGLNNVAAGTAKGMAVTAAATQAYEVAQLAAAKASMRAQQMLKISVQMQAKRDSAEARSTAAKIARTRALMAIEKEAAAVTVATQKLEAAQQKESSTLIALEQAKALKARYEIEGAGVELRQRIAHQRNLANAEAKAQAAHETALANRIAAERALSASQNAKVQAQELATVKASAAVAAARRAEAAEVIAQAAMAKQVAAQAVADAAFADAAAKKAAMEAAAAEAASRSVLARFTQSMIKSTVGIAAGFKVASVAVVAFGKAFAVTAARAVVLSVTIAGQVVKAVALLAAAVAMYGVSAVTSLSGWLTNLPKLATMLATTAVQFARAGVAAVQMAAQFVASAAASMVAWLSNLPKLIAQLTATIFTFGRAGAAASLTALAWVRSAATSVAAWVANIPKLVTSLGAAITSFGNLAASAATATLAMARQAVTAIPQMIAGFSTASGVTLNLAAAQVALATSETQAATGALILGAATGTILIQLLATLAAVGLLLNAFVMLRLAWQENTLGIRDFTKEAIQKMNELMTEIGMLPDMSEFEINLEEIEAQAAETEEALRKQMEEMYDTADAGFALTDVTDILTAAFEALLIPLPMATRALAEFLASLASGGADVRAMTNALLDLRGVLNQLAGVQHIRLGSELELMELELESMVLQYKQAELSLKQRQATLGIEQGIEAAQARQNALEAQLLPLKREQAAIEREIELAQREDLNLLQQHLQLQIQLLPYKQALADVERRIALQQRSTRAQEFEIAQITLELLPYKQRIAELEQKISGIADKRLSLEREELELLAERAALEAELALKKVSGELEEAWKAQDVPEILRLEAIRKEAQAQKDAADDQAELLSDESRLIEIQNRLKAIGYEMEIAEIERVMQPLEDRLRLVEAEKALQEARNKLVLDGLEAERLAIQDAMYPIEQRMALIEYEQEMQDLKSRIVVAGLEEEKRAVEDLMYPLELQIEAAQEAAQAMQRMATASRNAFQAEIEALELESQKLDLRKQQIELNRALEAKAKADLVLGYIDAAVASGQFTEDEAIETLKRMGLWDDEIGKWVEMELQIREVDRALGEVKRSLLLLPSKVTIGLEWLIPDKFAPPPEYLRQYLQLPDFATGGIVPGPLGQPQLAIVHGGEQFLGTHRVIPPTVQTIESQRIYNNNSSTDTTNYNVWATYQQVQSPASIAMDLRALIGMSAR